MAIILCGAKCSKGEIPVWIYIEAVDELGNLKYLQDFFYHPFVVEEAKIKRFAVGFFHPSTGKFIIESQHQMDYQARLRISLMNGGSDRFN